MRQNGSVQSSVRVITPLSVTSARIQGQCYQHYFSMSVLSVFLPLFFRFTLSLRSLVPSRDFFNLPRALRQHLQQQQHFLMQHTQQLMQHNRNKNIRPHTSIWIILALNYPKMKQRTTTSGLTSSSPCTFTSCV